MYTFLVGDCFFFFSRAGEKKVSLSFSVIKIKNPTANVLQEVLTFLRSVHFGDNALDRVVCFLVGGYGGLGGFFSLFLVF